MPGKLYLILMTLATVLVLLSFWGVPALLFWCAYAGLTATCWRIALIVLGILWIVLIRPWKMFRDPVFKKYLSDLSKALEIIFFH